VLIAINDMCTARGKLTWNNSIITILSYFKACMPRVICRSFDAGWVQPLHYYALPDASKLCVLCSNVMPTMAVRNKAYRTWVIVEKSTFNLVSCGGRIMNAYCTCVLQGSYSYCTCSFACYWRLMLYT